MNEPKTFAKAGLGGAWVELTVVYALTLLALITLLKMNPLIAMVTTPFLMVVMLIGVMLLVQVLWMAVLGLERLGTACGLRKSPLS
ncbi:MAG: hypothetical protein H6959_06615 [Chromatiaceae bacterium]|nr:hypothetical protein [Gammaproteobacteria bacterium]MCP5300501.1 hypothetical protein [Chromatiaceae bacterium]MCP5422573.1 hypothetical protein [Chromatiaceae bacterium]